MITVTKPFKTQLPHKLPIQHGACFQKLGQGFAKKFGDVGWYQIDCTLPLPVQQRQSKRRGGEILDGHHPAPLVNAKS